MKHTVEGPKKRKDCNMSTWCRIVAKDGSTVGYTPDHVTAGIHAAAAELYAENARLKERYELEQIRYEGISSANDELREENRRLKDELQCVNECAVMLQRQVDGLRRRDPGK